MKFETFALERQQSIWENKVDYNLSESGVHPGSLNSLFDKKFVDEINNMSFHELDSIMTRVGKDCRIIFCGDYRQSDLKESNERQGLGRFLDILNRMGGFKRFEFRVEDIVRSDIVKDYIIQKSELGHV